MRVLNFRACLEQREGHTNLRSDPALTHISLSWMLSIVQGKIIILRWTLLLSKTGASVIWMRRKGKY